MNRRPVPSGREAWPSAKGVISASSQEYGLSHVTFVARSRPAIDGLRRAGCEIVPVTLPHTEYAIPVYYIVAPAEASANLARFDGVRYTTRSPQAKTLAEMYRKSRDEGFGAEVKRRILLGTYALSAGY